VTLSSYHDLIARKRVAFEARGFTDVTDADLPSSLFDHQKHGVEFGLRAGCGAEFYDTGLGKTAIALAWGQGVIRRTNKPVLMLAPLAVGPQHAREAERLSIETKLSRFGIPPEHPCIAITNYERLERFDPADYAGVILDESSILKSFTGKTTRKLIDAFAATPYRLACTATPAPNDHSEIGTHAAFLGVMGRDEMLTRWFLHDSADTGMWRIKGHAAGDFWRWVASWARCVAKPSDLGFSDDGFELPPLNLHRHTVEADRSIDPGEEKKTGQGLLFRIPNTSATSIHKEKRLTKDTRAAKITELVLAEPDEPWLIWCETDYDAEALTAILPGVVNVHGKLSVDRKEELLNSFTTGETKWLLTKPSIAGFGLNWQHCARMAFLGLSFSYESFYQAVRRCWRFRQTRAVEVHVACADTEASIWEVVSRKADDHGVMKAEMAAAMRAASAAQQRKAPYLGNQEPRLPAWMVS
jgi:hypothetical protein